MQYRRGGSGEARDDGSHWALSPLLWLATATAWYGKGVEAEPATVERYVSTVAFLKVGDTLVNDELLR